MKRKIVSLYRNGHSLQAIAEVTGLSRNKVKAVVVEAGVALQKPGGWRRS